MRGARELTRACVQGARRVPRAPLALRSVRALPVTAARPARRARPERERADTLSVICFR